MVAVEISTQGQLLSFREISCFLQKIPVFLDGNPSTSSGKPVGAFYITVSNDGNQISGTEGFVIIYDSKCLECTRNGTRTCNTKVTRFIF